MFPAGPKQNIPDSCFKIVWGYSRARRRNTKVASLRNLVFIVSLGRLSTLRVGPKRNIPNSLFKMVSDILRLWRRDMKIVRLEM